MSELAPIEGSNKRIAILIALLAALLAIAEIGGKSAQTASLSNNIEASNLWAFFQAKTIRQTALRTAAETLDLESTIERSPARVEAQTKQIAAWRATVARYESEPSTGEGRRELTVRAQAAEAKRDRNLAAYHNFEFATAAFQLAIVLASASVVTAIAALALASVGLGVIGVAFSLLGWFAPSLHLL